MMSVGVRFEGVQFAAKGKLLLDVPCLEVKPSACMCVLGANGAGKSLLLEAMCGLLPITGRVGFEQHDSHSTRPVRLGEIRIGSALQRSNLWRYLRVSELVQFVEAIIGAPLAMDDILARIESRHLMYLSAGERQYLKCFLALQSGADLVVLDEPMANLDPHAQEAVRLRINASTVTRIVSLHNFLDAAQISSEGCYICRGRVLKLSIVPSVSLEDTVVCDLMETGLQRHGDGCGFVSTELSCKTDGAFERLNVQLIPLVDEFLTQLPQAQLLLRCTVPEKYV